MSEKLSEGDLLQFLAGPFVGAVVEVVAVIPGSTLVRISKGVYIRLSNSDSVLAPLNT